MRKETILLFILLSVRAAAQADCTVRNTAFLAGEELHYQVRYNWGMIWLESAEATFRVENGTFNKKPCYHFSGSGHTYPRYDWFFKVRDNFESFVDTVSFQPLKFTADIQEGPKKEDHLYLFDRKQDRVYTIITRGKKLPKVDTIKTSSCSIDVLTAIYYARNIDYSKCRENDTIGISVMLDGKIFPLYIRYLGKDHYSSALLGNFKCIKFRPLLVEGSIFRKGEHMTVWVTDDDNKLPLYIETEIIVGTVKVYLSDYKGLRYAERARLQK